MAQTPATAPANAAFDPLTTFAPLTLPQPAGAQRSASGAPGPGYWQNRADYAIRARLDPKSKRLAGDVVITYTNHSPDTLSQLWLEAHQNTYRRGARSAAQEPTFTPSAFTDGLVLERVEVEDRGRYAVAGHLVSDTRFRVDLPRPLAGNGGRVRLRIAYHYTAPGDFGGRTAWAPSADGDIFQIAQWYPRVAVYDDLRGWDTLPYLANEFYAEFGTFDYAVTVPADMIVAGSGRLTNPNEVLTPVQRARLARAASSDATVTIRSADEVVATPPAGDAVRTWRFRMENSRDVAFAASRAFVWDAARLGPSGKVGLAMSFYPRTSGGPDAWGRSTEYVKFAIDDVSRRWFPYPWPTAINVAGPVGGMEYPGIFFNSAGARGKPLFAITLHEANHSLVPMIVGADERRDAWMDEGFSTFISVLQSETFAEGAYGPKRDAQFAPGPEAPADQVARILADPNAPSLMTRADAISERYRRPLTYFKSAYGLLLLRDAILGADRFDPAFRRFLRDWAFRHPKPSDFFRTMESQGGEDLSWFWRGWYLNTWTHDLAVEDVTYVRGRPENGVRVRVRNRGRLVLPAVLRVSFADGALSETAVPVETWLVSNAHTFTFSASAPVTEAVIDPGRLLPDSDRANNRWWPPASDPSP